MIASFNIDGFVSAPSLEAEATWHLHSPWSSAAPNISGRVTNTTGEVLNDVVVLLKGESRFLGTLEPGETRSFDITIGPQDPGPVTLGNSFNQYYFSSYSWSYGTPGWCFSVEGIYLTVPDVMRNEEFSCSIRGVTAREQEIRRRYRLLGSLVFDRDVSGGRGDEVYIFAWTDRAPMDVDLVGRNQDEESTTLYIFELPTTVEAQADWIEVPPGLTTWTVIDTDNPNTLRDIAPTKIRLDADMQAAFGFMPMPLMRLSQVDEVVIKFQGQGPLIVDAWDWAAEKWVTVALDRTTNSTLIRNPDDFLGPENAVHLRVMSEDPDAFSQVDYIKVAYRGSLAGSG
jgi:hypothetical protein